jgi:hypothetical protein
MTPTIPMAIMENKMMNMEMGGFFMKNLTAHAAKNPQMMT